MKLIVLFYFILLLFNNVTLADTCKCPTDEGQSEIPITIFQIENKPAIMLCNTERGVEHSPVATFLSAGFFNVQMCETNKVVLDFNNVHEICCDFIKEENSLSFISNLLRFPDEKVRNDSPKILYKVYFTEMEKTPKVKVELLNITNSQYLTKSLISEMNSIETLEIFIKALQGDEKSTKTFFEIRKKTDAAAGQEYSAYLSTYNRFIKHSKTLPSK